MLARTAAREESSVKSVLNFGPVPYLVASAGGRPVALFGLTLGESDRVSCKSAEHLIFGAEVRMNEGLRCSKPEFYVFHPARTRGIYPWDFRELSNSLSALRNAILRRLSGISANRFL